MPEAGYIKLHRSLLNWEWYGDQNTKAVFVHLLLTVGWCPEIHRGIKLERGQRICSGGTLSAELGLSRQQIRTAFAHLKATGEITVEPIGASTNASTNGLNPQSRIITVINYERYQPITDEATNTLTNASTNDGADEQPTYKGIDKNIRNTLSSVTTVPDDQSPKRARGKPVYAHDETPYRIAVYLAGKIMANYPRHSEITEAQLQAWADSARLLLERDKRSREEIKAAIDFSQSDEFWRQNILSAGALRKQFDRLLIRSGAGGMPDAEVDYNRLLYERG